jgi:Protein of unknown function (DUF3592)
MRSWLFTAIFLTVGLGLLGGGVYSFVSTREFLGNAVSADGVVIDLEERWDSDDSSYTYYPRVRFATETGQPYEFTGDVGSSPAAFDVGEGVRVLFDPADPSSARIDSFMQLWFASMILGGMGLIFSIVGGGSIFAFGGAGKRRNPLTQAARVNIAPAAEPGRENERPVLPARRSPSVVERDRRD